MSISIIAGNHTKPYALDLIFVKKAEEAAAFLKKNGVPSTTKK